LFNHEFKKTLLQLKYTLVINHKAMSVAGSLPCVPYIEKDKILEVRTNITFPKELRDSFKKFVIDNISNIKATTIRILYNGYNWTIDI